MTRHEYEPTDSGPSDTRRIRVARKAMADAAIDEALRLAACARESGDRDAEAQAVLMLARVFREARRNAEASAAYREAHQLGAGTGDDGLFDWFWPERYSSFDEARHGQKTTVRLDPLEIEVLVGYVAVKTIGPFLEAFAKKLGEQFAETLGHALGRLRLLLDRRTNHRELDIATSSGITLVLPDPLPDEALLALLDLDVTDPELQRARLYWDKEACKWQQSPQEDPDPTSADGRRGRRQRRIDDL
ncbi:hypothetical protein ABH935_005842 [Catenulispora sp. GAS73]|uniref:hypothetical protein n=1 Tax=Catenulispora sp. GAS73 TaxID=3156269 RepID=UPI0035160014